MLDASRTAALACLLLTVSAPIAAAQEGLTDPNLASSAQLTDIGLTEEAAAALTGGRPYGTMLEVDSVLASHLDQPAREALYSHLFLRLDLNTATREEILLVPGVGNRMAHEFEEYRPYTKIIEFRREIGKYVDDDEVARLEQYVRVPE